jgi:predicted RecA/RadA family phage recombinase
MIFCLSSLSRILAVLFLLVAVVPAQLGEAGELTAEQIQAMRGQRQNAAKAKQKGDFKEEAADDAAAGARWAAMTPGERLAANVRRGSKSHCRFVAVCRPPKLLPGESGTLMITAILQGQAVLSSPLQMTMTPRVNLGSVSLGDLVAHPALPGTMAKAYLGRPVYENTAVFEVPVTMGNDVRLGEKTSVSVDLQFDVYHGESGLPVGRFIERVTTNVDVAPHIDPQIVGRKTKSQDEPEAVSIAPPKPTNSETTTKPDSNAMGGTAVVIPAGGSELVEVDEPATSGDLPPTGGDGGGVSFMMIIGGGVFLLAMLVLLMRKN